MGITPRICLKLFLLWPTKWVATKDNQWLPQTNNDEPLKLKNYFLHTLLCMLHSPFQAPLCEPLFVDLSLHAPLHTPLCAHHHALSAHSQCNPPHTTPYTPVYTSPHTFHAPLNASLWAPLHDCPHLSICRLIQVSLGIYRVFQTFFWPAEFPGYHQCQQESQ